MEKDQGNAKSPMEHIDAIFNARFVLSFVGEAMGQSGEILSKEAFSGVSLIMDSLRDDLQTAGNALIGVISNNGRQDVLNASPGRVAGVEGRIPN